MVTELGAALRLLQSDGRDLINGFGPEDRIRGGRGQHLMPWPNRIRDGRYRFDQADHQLALSEPERQNAIHGLVRWLGWELMHHAADRVTQQVIAYPQQGWDTVLLCSITHQVAADGLTITVGAENIGDRPVPFGYAAHPYLTTGEQRIDEIRVTAPASSYLRVDERLLPIGVASVSGRPEDLRAGSQLGSIELDTAFTDLSRDDSGGWQVRLARDDRETTLWADQDHHWLQIFTGAGDRSVGLAVEPMTCGPDAFNSSMTAPGLVVLSPGEQYQGRWGIFGH